MPLETTAADVESAIRRHGGPLLRAVTLFDIYRGRPLQDSEKSLAYRLTLRDDDRTLTESEVESVVSAGGRGAGIRHRGARPDLTGADRTALKYRRPDGTIA